MYKEKDEFKAENKSNHRVRINDENLERMKTIAGRSDLGSTAQFRQLIESIGDLDEGKQRNRLWMSSISTNILQRIMCGDEHGMKSIQFGLIVFFLSSQ